jgi:hypothetical protein
VNGWAAKAGWVEPPGSRSTKPNTIYAQALGCSKTRRNPTYKSIRGTDIPLQLIKEERRLLERIEELEQAIGGK